MKDRKISLQLNSWFQPFTKVVAEQKSPLSRLEPVEKSTNLREIDALDVEFSRWLPLAELFRTKYKEDITNLGRLLKGHKGLSDLLKESSNHLNNLMILSI